MARQAVQAELTVGEIALQAMGELTPAERRVARVLVASYPIAGLETVAKLAERAEVSGPTVIRFVAKLGFAGFPEFQQALREEVQARISSPLTLYERGPRTRSKVQAAAAETFRQALELTFEALPPAEFQGVVDHLADERRRIVCTGGRYSQILAYSLYAHLHTLRAGTRFVGPGPAPREEELIDVGRREVLAVFDYRRYQQDTIDFAIKAADRGATVLLFTDPWLSPIAQVATHVLPASVESASPFDSMVPAMALVEAVVAGLLIELGPRARRRFERLEEVRGGFTWDGDAATLPRRRTRGRSPG